MVLAADGSKLAIAIAGGIGGATARGGGTESEDH